MSAGRQRHRAAFRAAVHASWLADRKGTIFAALLQTVGAASALGVVLASKLAFDALLADGGVGHGLGARLVTALALLAAMTAISGSASALQQQHQRVQGERVAQLLWRRMLDVCARVDLATWQSTAFMDRLDRVRANALSRPALVVASLFTLAGSVLGVVTMAAALLMIEPLLLPVLLVAGVPAVLVSRVASRTEFTFSKAVNALSRRRFYLKQLVTSRAPAAEIRAFDSGALLLARHDDDDRGYLEALTAQARKRQWLSLVSTAASALALTVTLLLIVVFLNNDRISLAEAGAAAIAARLLGGQLSSVFGSVGSLIESGPFLADMQAFFEETPEVEPPAHIRGLKSELALDEVRFAYPGQARPALGGVSITIPRGSVVALVGENGSGKTTLAKIVGGLYAPEAGKISWDGDASISMAELRASSAVLFQDFVHYQMSGRDNIAIARPDDEVDLEHVMLAAHRAGIDDALSGLADGYDTMLGVELEEGADLSGGQWQRVALARAFYRDRSLIVLDEPTASLDARAEHELFADVRRVLDGRSALLISHRYSSVRLADHIYVLAKGLVVEDGTHEELMQRGGRYAELYALQAAAYHEGVS